MANNLKFAALLVALASMAGCSAFSGSEKKPEDPTKTYKVSFRQLPPEPVYNRVRAVHLPDVAPAKGKPASRAEQFVPSVKLSLKNSTLEQAGVALAALGNYQAYTASSIVKQRVSLEAYGTIDQVAQELAKKSSTHIVVDHANRQVRILKKAYDETTKPEFSNDNSAKEVGSSNHY